MKPLSCLLIFSLCIPSLAIPQEPPKAYCVKTLAPIAGGPRQEQSVVALGDDIYILAGLRQTNTTEIFSGAVEKYNILNNTWSTLPSLPFGVHHTNVASVNGKIYYLGGLIAKDGNIFRSEVSGESLVFDPAVGKWEGIASMPEARGSCAMGVLGTTIWCAGGLSGGMQAIDTVSSYDTKENKWTTWPNLRLPEARDHAGAAVVDGIFYVVGGRVGGTNQNRGTVYALDLNEISPATGWVTKASMPSPRGGLAAAAAGKKIWTFGGEGNKADAKGVFGDVAVYDIEKDCWAVGPPMKDPRHGFGAAAIGDRVYVPGGGAHQGGGEPLAVKEVYGAC
jgi:N-acetylneuraminic acid mutarotase